MLKKRCVLELPRLSRPPFKSDSSSNLEALNIHYENLLSFKICVISIMEATMMPVEKLRGEAELDSDTNDMKFFLLSVVAVYPARACSDTSDDFLPEEQSTVTWLPSLWEVRTKVTCDALTSMVSTS